MDLWPWEGKGGPPPQGARSRSSSVKEKSTRVGAGGRNPAKEGGSTGGIEFVRE